MYSLKTTAPAQAPSLREIFDRHTLAATRMRIDGQQLVYATGEEDEALYLIEQGQVKISMASAEGKDCLLAIYGPGDVFGESCFDGNRRRGDTATAMTFTIARRALKWNAPVRSRCCCVTSRNDSRTGRWRSSI